MKNPQYITSIDKIQEIPGSERLDLSDVTTKFAFRTNEYYASLINWEDPEDPIRKIIIPDSRELDEWGDLDASSEKTYTVAPGCSTNTRRQHLYLRSMYAEVSAVSASGNVFS